MRYLKARFSNLAWLAAFAILTAGLAACSDDTSGGAGGTGDTVKRGLLILGQATVKTVPNAQHQLRVFLYESGSDGAKGIPSKNLTFSFLGNSAGSTLQKNTVTTDQDGRGVVDLAIGAKAATFQVQAAAAQYEDVKPVYFSV